ncbi:unnamed protein product [Parnassius apollo]|uniref:(apollo) hypothetical protein n=1 Tax=Parnassius apollo TaxID=110799 RepID=A0A8S3X392_PARAO|nr:unnamed protein product [Parnassius apollo]
MCYKKCQSSFHGKISEIPGISVDNFTGKNATSRAYFLSHFHADHIQGLDEPCLLEHLKKTNVFIYTTEVTLTVMRHEFGDIELLEYVKGLNKESKLITLPSVPEDDLDEMFVEVTLIPAGHCMGSTMFLFKTTKKTILYTGDFRIRINDIPKYAKLHERNGDPINIDAMYVDTTFIKEEFEDFPKRSETVDTVIFEINRWLKTSAKYAVAIYMPANFTYEFIFNQIQKRLNTKVYVNDKKWRLYSTIPELVPGITNDDSETRIHLCASRSERNSHPSCVRQDYEKYLFVYLTAMKWDNYNVDSTPVNRVTPTRIDACFATHCSRREVVSFVSYFKPVKVEGFPNGYVAATPIKKSIDEFVLSPKDRSPSGVKRKYSTTADKHNMKNVTKKIF